MQWHNVSAPYWDDRPVLIVGAGASLKGFDLTRLQGLGYVLAVKGAMFDIPWATAGFGLDLPRYREWQFRLEDAPYPVYWAFPEDENITRGYHFPANILPLKRVRGDSLSDGPDYVYNGGTSGFGALNLAVLKRAKQIMLFGFDFHATGEDWHFNDSQYSRHRAQNPIRWKEWCGRFATVIPQLEERGIEVLNASPESRLPGFRRSTLDDAVDVLYAVKNGWTESLLSGQTIDPPTDETPLPAKPRLNKRGRPKHPDPTWVLR